MSSFISTPLLLGLGFHPLFKLVPGTTQHGAIRHHISSHRGHRMRRMQDPTGPFPLPRRPSRCVMFVAPKENHVLVQGK